MNTRKLEIITDVLLLGLSSLLIFSIFTDLFWINSYLIVPIVFFLPGWTITRIFFNDLKSTLAKVIIAFPISIATTAIISSIFVVSHLIEASIIVCFVYFGFAGLPVLKDILRLRKNLHQVEHAQRDESEVNLFEIFSILLVFILFIIFLALLYPDMGFRKGLDSVRFYSQSLQVLFNPQLVTSRYPWFHTSLSTLHLLSNIPIEFFQLCLVFLSGFTILSFHKVSKTYLKNFDSNIPILATIFWTFFSGFGWLVVFKNKFIVSGNVTYDVLISQASDASYFDVIEGQGPQIWLWFRPLTIGFTLVLVLLYLLKQNELSKKQTVALGTILVVTMGLIHFSELVVFTFFVLGIILLIPSSKMRTWEVSLSLFLGNLIIIPFLSVYSYIFSIQLISSVILIFMSVVGILCFLLVHFHLRIRRIIPRIKFSIEKNIAKLYFLLSVISIISWLIFTDFSATLVSDIGAVPFSLYPVLLGINGILGLIGIICLKNSRKSILSIFSILILIGFVIGKFVTYFNLTFFHLGYWEIRIIPFLFIGLSIFAAIGVKAIKAFLTERGFHFGTNQVLALSLVILGVSSTLIAIEQQQQIVGEYKISNQELDSVKYLTNINYSDAKFLTITDNSYLVSDFFPSGWAINEFRDQIWSSTSPEQPLGLLSSDESSTLVYLDEKDLSIMDSDYSDGYLGNHLVTRVNTIYDKDEIAVLEVPKMSFPLPKSDVVLVVPPNPDQSIYFVYDILSSANIAYSTALEWDINTISNAKTIIVPYEKLGEKILNYREQYDLKFEKLIVMNLDGYGDMFQDVFTGYPIKAEVLSPEGVILGYANSNSSKYYKELRTDTGTLSFEIKNVNVETQPIIISDDNFTETWTPKGIIVPGIEGNISAPVLQESMMNLDGDKNSLKITVSRGNFSQWELSTTFLENLDFSNYHFATFYWYGRGDGNHYDIQFHSTPNDYFFYSFKDSWIGWKNVVLPLNIPDGSWEFKKVQFFKSSQKEPSWDKIEMIRFLLSGSNLNVGGKFSLGRFTVDQASNVELVVNIEKDPSSLIIHGIENENPLIINPGDSFAISNLTLMDETVPLNTLLGKQTVADLQISKEDDNVCFFISFFLPPTFSQDNPSTIEWTIEPTYKEVNSSYILEEDSDEKINLPTPLKMLPLSANGEVLASFEGNIPFMVVLDEKTYRIYYQDIYSLQKNVLDEYNFLEDYFQPLRDLILVPLENSENTNVSSYDSLELFKTNFVECQLEGEITIDSQSFLVKPTKGDIEYVLNEKNVSSANVIDFVVWGSDIQISVRCVHLSGHTGFYVAMDSIDDEFNLEGNAEGIMITYANGSQKLLDGGNLQMETKNLIARSPLIETNGSGVFTDFYGYWEAYTQFRTLGQNLIMNGSILLQTFMGDTYVTGNINFAGVHERIPSLYQYNDLTDVAMIVPFLVVILFWESIKKISHAKVKN